LWGFRRQVSLLLANGHPAAATYPLGLLNEECDLVVQRLNRQTVTEAILLQMAVSSLFSSEGGDVFSKQISKLMKD